MALEPGCHLVCRPKRSRAREFTCQDVWRVAQRMDLTGRSCLVDRLIGEGQSLDGFKLSPDQLVTLFGTLSKEEKSDALNALLLGVTFAAGVGVGSSVGVLGALPCTTALQVLIFLDIIIEMEPLLIGLSRINEACATISCIASLIGRVLPTPYKIAYNATVPLACVNAIMADVLVNGGMKDIIAVKDLLEKAFVAKCGVYDFPYSGVIRGIIESKLTQCGGSLWP
jgi:hypothetical protein